MNDISIEELCEISSTNHKKRLKDMKTKVLAEIDKEIQFFEKHFNLSKRNDFPINQLAEIKDCIFYTKELRERIERL